MPTRWYEYEPEDTYLKRKEKERQKGILEKIQPPAVTPAPTPPRPQMPRPQTPTQSADPMPWRPQAQAQQTPSWLQPFTPTPQPPMSLPPAPTTITPWSGRQEPMSVAPSPQFSASLPQRQTPAPVTPPVQRQSLGQMATGAMQNLFPSNPVPGESMDARNRRLGLDRTGAVPEHLNVGEALGEGLRDWGNLTAGIVGTAERLGGAISGVPREKLDARLQQYGAPTGAAYTGLNPVEQWKANTELGRQIWKEEVFPVLDSTYREGAGWRVGVLAGLKSGKLDAQQALDTWLRADPVAKGAGLGFLQVAKALGLGPRIEGADSEALQSVVSSLDALAETGQEQSLRQAWADRSAAVKEAYELEATAPLLVRLVAGFTLDPVNWFGAMGATGQYGVLGDVASGVDMIQNHGFFTNMALSDDPAAAVMMYGLQAGGRQLLTALANKTVKNLRPGQPLSVDQQVEYLAEAGRIETLDRLAKQGLGLGNTGEEAAQYSRSFDDNLRVGAAQLYQKIANQAPLSEFEQAILTRAQTKFKLDNDPALYRQVEHLQKTLARARTSLERGWANVSDATRQRWEAMGMTREAGEVPVGGPLAGRPEEPWRMAADDYVSRYRSEYVEGRLQTDSGLRRIHEKLVADALARGDDVPMTARPEWAIPFEEFARREWGGDAYGQQKAIENDAALREQYALVIDSAVKRGDPVPADILAARRSPASTLPLGDALRPVFGGAQQARPQMDAPNAAPEPLRLEMQYADDAARTQAERQAAEAAGQTSMFGEARRVSGQVLGADIPTKSMWEMSRDELDSYIAQLRTRDAGLEASLFGADEAQRYAAAQRTVNSVSASASDVARAGELIRRMEAALTPGQQNRLFGIGAEGDALDTVRALRDALGWLDWSSPDDLGRSLRRYAAAIEPSKPFEEMSEDQKVAYTVFRRAYDGALDEGWDTGQVSDAMVAAVARRYRDSDDARLMVQEILDKFGIQPRSQDGAAQPLGLPSLEAPVASPELRLALDMRIGQSERIARRKLFETAPPGKDINVDDYLELTRGDERLYVERANADEMRLAEEMGFARGDIIAPEAVPDVLYHVTYNLPAVAQSKALLEGDGKHGLGGPGGGISTVSSLEEAEWVQREMRRHIELANSDDPEALLSEYVAEDIAIERAIPFADADKIERGIRSAEKIAREIYNSNYMVGGAGEAVQPGPRGIRMYQSYVLGRADAGGQRDPVIMAGDDNYARFVGMSPDDVAILKIGKDAALAPGGNIYKMEDAVEGEILLPGPVRLDNAAVVVRGQERPLPAGGLTQGAQGLAAREESLRAKMIEDLRGRRTALGERATEIATREPVARVEEVPAEVTEPTVVARIRTGKVTLDPQRFQFKLDVNAEGVTRSLDNVQVWDPALGAGVSLWKDPANGKIYVVNGHHRVALARRLGVEYIEAPYMIAADTAEQARFIGAMQNIAGGRGTAIDAAKLFRENSLTDAELEARGISLSESLVRDGLALSRLHPTLFGAVVRKELPIRRAVIIGSKIESQDMQLQFLSEIDKLSAGRRTDAVISELADAFVGGPRGTVEQAGLWGTITQERSYVPERAEVAAYVKAELASDKRIFGGAARNAGELARVGEIDVPEAERIATSAAQMGELFDVYKNRVGPIADILNDAARRIGEGENATKVKKDAYEKITERLPEVQQGTVATGVREPASAGQPRPVEQAAVPEAPRPEPVARREPVSEVAGPTLDDVAARIQAQLPRGKDGWTLRGISRAQWDSAALSGEPITSRGDKMRPEAGAKGELQTTDNVTQAVAHAEGGVVIAIPRSLTKSKETFSVIRRVVGDKIELGQVRAVYDANTGEPLPLPSATEIAPAPTGARPPDEQPVPPRPEPVVQEPVARPEEVAPVEPALPADAPPIPELPNLLPEPIVPPARPVSQPPAQPPQGPPTQPPLPLPASPPGGPRKPVDGNAVNKRIDDAFGPPAKTARERVADWMSRFRRAFDEPFLMASRLPDKALYASMRQVEQATSKYQADYIEKIEPLLDAIDSVPARHKNLNRLLMLDIAQNIFDAPDVAKALTDAGLETHAPVRTLPAGLKDAADIAAGRAALEAEVGAAEYAELTRLADEFRRTMGGLTVDKLLAEGLITQDGYQQTTTLYPQYVPLFVVEPEADRVARRPQPVASVTGNPLQARSEFGPGKQIRDPLSAYVEQGAHVRRQILANRAAHQAVTTLTGLAKADPDLKPPFEVEKPIPKRTITLYENGEPKFYEVDGDWAREFLALDQRQQSQLAGYARYLQGIKARTAVVWNAAWSFWNVGKDAQDAFLKEGVWPVGFVKAFQEVNSKSPEYIKNIRAGAIPMGMSLSRRPEFLQNARAYHQWLDNNSLPAKSINKILDILKRGEDVLGMGEQVGRQRIANEMRKMHPGIPEDELMMAIREGTYDPPHVGWLVKELDNFILFSKATVSATAGMVRSAKRNPMGFLLRTAAFMAIQGLLFAWNSQFESADELPYYARYGLWPIIIGEYTPKPDPRHPGVAPKKKPIYIPIPKGYGVALTTAPLVALQRGLKEELTPWDAIGEMITDMVSRTAPYTAGEDFVFPVVSTYLQLKQNKDWLTGADIVPEDEILLPAWEQAGPETTLTARWIADSLKPLGLSPRVLDFIVRAEFSGMPADIAFFTDTLLREAGYDPKLYGDFLQKEYTPLEETQRVPFARRFLRVGGSEQARLDYLERNKQVSYWNTELAKTEEGQKLGLTVPPPLMEYVMPDGNVWSLTVEQMTQLLNTQEEMFIEALDIVAEQPWYTALEGQPAEQKEAMQALHSSLRSAARQLLYAGAPPLSTEQVGAVVYAMEKKRQYDAIPQWVDRRTRQPYSQEQVDAIAAAQAEVAELRSGTNPVARNENQAWQIWVSRSDNPSYATRVRQWEKDRLANKDRAQFERMYHEYLRLWSQLN